MSIIEEALNQMTADRLSEIIQGLIDDGKVVIFIDIYKSYPTRLDDIGVEVNGGAVQLNIKVPGGDND